MVAQIRTYTINKGMMDSWLELFDKEIRPVHQGLGIPIVATYVSADGADFVWVRTFATEEEIPAKEAAYFASDGRKALGNKPTDHIAKMDVRLVKEVLETAK
ncbi:MAG: NIPSNAP family protein [Chloroflexi bacterium]|nr:NIPSNAP family protein [Chloroflexota bacterium]